MRARPLVGRTVLCLGGAGTVTRLAARVRALGADALPALAFQLVPGDRQALRAAVVQATHGRYVGLCLTSSAGVAAVGRAMHAARLEHAEVLRDLLVGSVGPGTTRAVVDRLGCSPDIQPTVSTGAALGLAFPPGRGEVLLPVSDLASRALEMTLLHRGYTPVRITAYRNRGATRLTTAADEAVRRESVDLVLLTSPSAVRAYVRLVPAGLRASPAPVTIGPSTSAMCRRLGVLVAQEARAHDLDGLVVAAVDVAASHV